MAETLGTLCDKLTIVILKEWHTDDLERLAYLKGQATSLRDEINGFVAAALTGQIPIANLTFAANKVYKKQGNDIAAVVGAIGDVFTQLAQVNCELWHEQEKVYDFDAVPAAQKDAVVKALAHLNLRRNRCIDTIDRLLSAQISQSQSQSSINT